MKKTVLAFLALVAAVAVAEHVAIIKPVAVTGGSSVSNAIDTTTFVGRSEVVLNADKGGVTLEFLSAPMTTNGTAGAYSYQPTNNWALLKSYTFSKDGCSTIAFPAAAPTYGRWLQVVVKPVSNTVVSVEYAGRRQAF